MKRRTKTALGIDIGDRRISAALVEKTPQGVRVIASACADLAADQAQEPDRQAGAISRVVGELGGRVKIRGVRAAVAMSGGSVVMRLLDLPRQMPTNVSEFVHAELQQCVALSGHRIASDFCGVRATAGSRQRLLTVAADADQVGETLRTCGTAGIAVNSIEPAALAYARVFLAGEKDRLQSGNTLLAVLGARNLVVCLFCKGMLDFVRVREFPAGLDGPGPLGAWLSEELSAVLCYHRTSGLSGSPGCRVHLVIHEAAYGKDEIAFSLALEPGVKSLTVVDCWEPVATSSETKAGSSRPPSALAVGAALRLLHEGDDLCIDLTPHEMVQAKASSRGLLVLANVAAVILIGVFLISQLLARTTHAMHERIEQTRLAGQLYTMGAVVQEDKHIDQEITRLQEQLNWLQSVGVAGEADWPAALNTIQQATPEDVRIVHMACLDRRTVSLTGTAKTHEHAKTLVQNLDGRGPFESAWLTHVQRRRDDRRALEFEIRCIVRQRE